MSQTLNPNIFLFQELVGQLLELTKRALKKSKLDEVDFGSMLSQETTMNLQKYNQWLLLALGSPKTKQPLLIFYDKVFKQQLCDSRHLPQELISTLIADSENQQTLAMGRLLSTLLTSNYIFLSNLEKSKSLKYLLEGTRHKTHGQQFSVFFEDVVEWLVERSQPEIQTFIDKFIGHLVNEVELHQAADIDYSLLHQHESGAKYGRCFICSQPAPNYDKEVLVPLCGFECKNVLIQMRLRINKNEIFDVLSWLIDQSIYGDEVVFRLISRQLRQIKNIDERLTEKQLKLLLPELLKNAQKGQDAMVNECHRIFVKIFECYKIPFKNELKAYIKLMLTQLENQKDVGGKLALLRFFSQLFSNAQNINSIYANYDCKFYETNLLEDQIGLISRLSIDHTQEETVRQEAKKCIVALLQGQIEYLKKTPVSTKEIPQDIDELLRQKQIKTHAQKAILLFNEKPQTGINYLKQNYFENQEMTPSDIAKFIRQNTQEDSKTMQVRLKKQKIGEYFGSPKELPTQVYKAFIELLNFDGMSVDDATRELLNHFTLPKQSQQIDRVIEHFSDKYYPLSGMTSSQGCFQLIYSVVMLQSSLYNPNVRAKQKLNLGSFQSICSYIEGGVDKQKIQKLFYSIQQKPLSVRPQLSSEYLLSKAYLNPYDKYQESTSAELRSLLHDVWQYVYVSLVDRDNVDGLFQAVVVYGTCDMEEAEGFITALVKRAQNGSIKAYDNVLKLAAFHNSTLKKCWSHIVKFMFQMEESPIANKSQFDMSIIDQILTASNRLPNKEFIEFLKKFCEFSTSQFKDNNYNRELFVLKHIIEIIEYNLPRLKDMWQQVWPLLNDFYIRMCLHPRNNISMSSIDSLKQLTLKLMKMPEDNIMQQSQYMSPFLYVYERSGQNMKQLIVNIVGMLLGKEMASGWDIIYAILSRADESEAIVKVVDRVLTIGLDKVDNPEQIHKVMVKELLTISEKESNLVPKILQILSKLSTHINKDNVYFQTLKSLMEKYEITENPDMLRCFFDMIETLPRYTPQMFDLVLKLHQFTNRSRDYARSSLVSSYTNLINKKFLLDNFDKVKELWVMNLDSCNKRAFLPMLYELVKELVLDLNDVQLQSVLDIVVEKHEQSLPKGLLALASLDDDFEMRLQHLPQHPGTKADLIELSLQKEVYEYLCILHLLCLRLFKVLYQSNNLNEKQKAIVEQAVKKSYEIASDFNQRVLLRYFLWKNGFMSVHNQLPGLLKQELQSVDLLIQLYDNENLQQLSLQCLQTYHSKYQMLQRLTTMNNQVLKQVYKLEIENYIVHFKQIILTISRRLGRKEKHDRVKQLYTSILNIVEVARDTEIIRQFKELLYKLLRQLI